MELFANAIENRFKLELEENLNNVYRDAKEGKFKAGQEFFIIIKGNNGVTFIKSYVIGVILSFNRVEISKQIKEILENTDKYLDGIADYEMKTDNSRELEFSFRPNSEENLIKKSGKGYKGRVKHVLDK
ncbi:hypothetical protein GF376_04370 [Candidatus Peregrinibacteria bacterium]|nr:hypothetical protein [Candidatus Peregrinibacteria bacterium]